MCYLIITGGSLIWFLLSLIADMFVISAIVTPKWLIAPAPHSFTVPRIRLATDEMEQNEILPQTTSLRYPSVGIYTRCKAMKGVNFQCGNFDLDGFATDSEIYPTAWKVTMFFISLGFVLLTLTVVCTLLSCCRQSVFGKSIHNMTACVQVIAGNVYSLIVNALELERNVFFLFFFFFLLGISVMMSLFLHPLGWGASRVQLLCGPDAEPFYAANCSIGNI